jgi:dTMP kinase
VLSDRFTGSTLAYQGYGRQLDQDLIRQLATIATGGLTADLTLWLSLPVAISLQRRGKRQDDRMEAAGGAFLERVAAGFAAEAVAQGWVMIDASQPAAQVSLDLESTLRDQARAWL